MNSIRKFMIIFLAMCLSISLMACTGNLPSKNIPDQNSPTETPIPEESGAEDGQAIAGDTPTQEAETEKGSEETAADDPQPETVPTELPADIEQLNEIEEEKTMQMKIGNTIVDVEWEDNASVRALEELTADIPLTIQMSMYGGFEQVGPIGQSLTRNDVQTTTQAGDIVLYSGNQIVVFYGSNSWAYTRLGHIRDKTPQELAELLGSGNITLTIGKGL